LPWTKITRPLYVRRGRRYASDSTDAEWALVAGYLPSPKRIGRPRTTELRDVLDAILYMAATGCQWAMLPNDFPPPSTVQRYFYDWRDSGLLRTINHHLVMADRERVGREASPTAVVLDSQSVKITRVVDRAATMPARVRLDGAHHLWRKVPSGELSIDPEADERLGRATGRVEAS